MKAQHGKRYAVVAEGIYRAVMFIAVSLFSMAMRKWGTVIVNVIVTLISLLKIV
jgi:hypothetical protein